MRSRRAASRRRTSKSTSPVPPRSKRTGLCSSFRSAGLARWRSTLRLPSTSRPTITIWWARSFPPTAEQSEATTNCPESRPCCMRGGQRSCIANALHTTGTGRSQRHDRFLACIHGVRLHQYLLFAARFAGDMCLDRAAFVLPLSPSSTPFSADWRASSSHSAARKNLSSGARPPDRKSTLPVEVAGPTHIGPRRTPVPTTAAYMPPNGFCTVSLLVTEVTPGTPCAISATLPTWEASVTVPVSVTAPSLATTLIFPALISLCFEMAL